MSVHEALWNIDNIQKTILFPCRFDLIDLVLVLDLVTLLNDSAHVSV